MSNTINSGTASALNANETLLARAITSSGDKIGFEFHEVISNGDAGMPGIGSTERKQICLRCLAYQQVL